MIEEDQMHMSQKERFIISNQLKILGILNSNSSNIYKADIQALERGFEKEYPKIMENILVEKEVMTCEECEEVYETLEMFQSIDNAFSALPNKSTKPLIPIHFDGYDGNHEGKFLAYANYLIKEKGLFQNHNAGIYPNYNLGSARRDKYQLLVAKWKKYSLQVCRDLTIIELTDILS